MVLENASRRAVVLGARTEGASGHDDSRRSRRAVVVLQHSAESRVTSNCPGAWSVARPHRRSVFDALVRARCVVIVHELVHEVIEVPLAEHDEMVQALVPGRSSTCTQLPGRQTGPQKSRACKLATENRSSLERSPRWLTRCASARLLGDIARESAAPLTDADQSR